MPTPSRLTLNLQLKTSQFYGLLILVSYFGVARGGPELNIAGSDLILHWAGYTILMISSRIAHAQHPVPWFAGLLAYSITIEIIQYFLPYRTFSLLDILANLAGLVAGTIIWEMGKHYRKLTASDRGADEGEQG